MRDMFPLTRILISIVLSIASLTVGFELPDAGPAEPDSTDPNVVIHESADSRWNEAVIGAVDRFEAAGLGLFDVDVHVWSAADSTARCHDNAGWFSPLTEGTRVEICLDYQDTDLGTHLRDKLLLHEMAHAWIHTNAGDAIRDIFMASHGIEAWNDHTQPHNRRGAEIAANTMMYALHPDEPTNADQICGYELITGHTTPFGRIDTCTAR
jgi:hypothetical protein